MLQPRVVPVPNTPHHATEVGTDPRLAAYETVRDLTGELCRGLATEDFVVQSMPDVSPTQSHLAHTSWFFETLVLKPHLRGYQEWTDPRGWFSDRHLEVRDV